MSRLSIVILTGQSGSGKSTAVRSLEDQGYYCVDNLPTRLVEELVRTLRDEGNVTRVALVMDARNPSSLREAPSLVQRLRTQAEVRVVYFESNEATLLRRYSETRRRHPLDQGAGLRDAILREREILNPLREIADDTLDTSAMSPHELRARVSEKVAGVTLRDTLRIAVVSFGFKHGLPLEADMVLDVRFLANPFFEPQLRDLTGLDEPVRKAVLAQSDTVAFIDHAMSFLQFLVPRFQGEGKRYLTVAIGCTGGQHRSVVVANELAQRLRTLGLTIDLRHRDARPKVAREGSPQ
jgi:RNase adapter protein RapZ